MRATTAGITSVAATSVTPMMLSVARIDIDEHDHEDRVHARDVDAGDRGDVGVERGEQQLPVEHREHRDGARRAPPRAATGRPMRRR